MIPVCYSRLGMGIKRHQNRTDPGRTQNGDGLAKWLLGALGIIWVWRLAFRNVPEGVPVRLADRLAEAPPGEGSEPIRAHEHRDADARWIFGIVLFLLISGLAIHGILAGFLSLLKSGAAPKDQWRPVEAMTRIKPAHPPFPVLQVSPPADLKEFRAREEAELGAYGWINRTSGVVRIPIDRAMDLVLQEGLPTRTSNGQAGPSSYDLIQRRLENREPEIKGGK